MKQFSFYLLSFFIFLYLMLFPAKALSATTHALILWSGSVVPALLPLMILSRFLITSDSVYFFLKPFSFLGKHLFSLTPFGSYALLIGFLCGYPMGVKTLSDLQKSQLISQDESFYLAGFINQISPGFLITYICTRLLHQSDMILPYVLIIYGASLTYGLMFKPNCIFSNSFSISDPHYRDKTKKTSDRPSLFSLLDVTIEESITQILKIGGYMVLFSIFSSSICCIPVIPDFVKAILSAFLEISYGAEQLYSLSLSPFIKYLLLTIFLAFGGLCSAFQSSSYLFEIGLSMKKYIKTKAMISVIALVFYLIYSYRNVTLT